MAARRPANRPTKARRNESTLVLIALFKLVKAILLIAVGIGAIKLLHRDVAATVLGWVDILRVDPDNRFIHRILSRVLFITPAQLKAASAGPSFTQAFCSRKEPGCYCANVGRSISRSSPRED